MRGLVDAAESKATTRISASPFSSPWAFLARAVWTKDEASGQIRQFPAEIPHEGTRFEYLHHLTTTRTQHTVLAVEKSRRMMVTWWALALYLHDIMYHKNHLNAIASDKLEKSAYLLGGDRMELIYRLMPPIDLATENWLRTLGVPLEPFKEVEWTQKPPVIFESKQGMGWKLARCESTASSCMAVASGESQMQQYTFSNVLMDEYPRWKWQEESWRNIQPTIQGGGHVDIICTAELGSYAYDLLYDANE